MNRSALCAPLMLSLICVLGAPPPKPKTPVDEDPEEDDRDTESDRVSQTIMYIVHVCNVVSFPDPNLQEGNGSETVTA